MNWVADHRKHHAHTDQEGDPHTPHGHGSGVKGAVTGLWYAHMGWLFEHSGTSEHQRYARDLYEDRGMRLHPPDVRAVGGARDRDPGRDRPRGHRHLARRVRGGAVGRRGADLPRPPRDLVDQLRLPLLRHAALRCRGPLDQRLLARRCSRWASPGTTTTTRSRAGVPRPEELGDRPDRAGDPRHAARRSSPGTWSRSRPSASARSWPEFALLERRVDQLADLGRRVLDARGELAPVRVERSDGRRRAPRRSRRRSSAACAGRGAASGASRRRGRGRRQLTSRWARR